MSSLWIGFNNLILQEAHLSFQAVPHRLCYKVMYWQSSTTLTRSLYGKLKQT